MLHSVLWLSAAALLTLFVGPLGFVLSQEGRADPADLYIVVGVGPQSFTQQQLINLGASGVGPLRAPLTTLIHAPPSSRENLLQAGYVMLPAGALAMYCGIGTDTITPRKV